MFRAAMSSMTGCLILASVAAAQEDKPYTPAVGQKYKATQNGAVVIKDAKSTSEFIKARRKVDTEKIMNMMNAGSVERIPEGTVLEVVKVDPKSEEHPSGLIECKRIVEGEDRGSVYLGADILVPVFLTPADEATKKSSSLPAPESPFDNPSVRKWKAATGGFEVEAELVSSDGKNVVLKRKMDGKEITVGLDKLSEEDRTWLADQARAAETEEPEPDIAFKIEPPDLRVTATKLADDFAADKNAAREKYGKGVCVDGVVQRITDEELGGQKFQYVELKAGENRIVKCGVTIYWTKHISKLRPGSKVAIAGILVDLESEKPFIVSMTGANFMKPK